MHPAPLREVLLGLSIISSLDKHLNAQSFQFQIFHLICSDSSLFMATDVYMANRKLMPYLMSRKLMLNFKSAI